jgi:hypothetical protein
MPSADPDNVRLAQLELALLDGRLTLPERRELLRRLAGEPRRDLAAAAVLALAA